MGDQDTGKPDRLVFFPGLPVSGEPGHCRARTRPLVTKVQTNKLYLVINFNSIKITTCFGSGRNIFNESSKFQREVSITIQTNHSYVNRGQNYIRVWK